MIPQSKAKIFPAGERGCSRSEGTLSRYCFSFESYRQAHRMPFGSLLALNDDILAAGHSLQFTAPADMFLVLVPVIGAVSYYDSLGNEVYLVAGYVQMIAIRKGTSFALLNPYHDEAVNFLQLWIQRKDGAPEGDTGTPAEAGLEEHPDELQSLISHPQVSVSLGRYGGRKEGHYRLKNSGNGIFVFVIDGQMEVQYRLLQARDGLSFCEQEEIEWECLTASAILLIAEVKMQQ